MRKRPCRVAGEAGLDGRGERGGAEQAGGSGQGGRGRAKTPVPSLGPSPPWEPTSAGARRAGPELPSSFADGWESCVLLRPSLSMLALSPAPVFHAHTNHRRRKQDTHKLICPP